LKGLGLTPRALGAFSRPLDAMAVDPDQYTNLIARRI
jgi:hypothetical protein